MNFHINTKYIEKFAVPLDKLQKALKVKIIALYLEEAFNGLFYFSLFWQLVWLRDTPRVHLQRITAFTSSFDHKNAKLSFSPYLLGQDWQAGVRFTQAMEQSLLLDCGWPLPFGVSMSCASTCCVVFRLRLFNASSVCKALMFFLESFFSLSNGMKNISLAWYLCWQIKLQRIFHVSLRCLIFMNTSVHSHQGKLVNLFSDSPSYNVNNFWTLIKKYIYF